MNFNNRIKAILILIALVLVWGSSFILMKRGLEVFPSNQVAALRLSITFFVLFPFVIRKIKSEIPTKWKLFLLTGLLGNGIPAFLFAKAQTGLNSYLAGVLNSLTPLFALIIGLIFYKLKVKWYNVIGVILGLIGAIGLMSVGEKNFFGNNLGYGSYIIVATILYAFNINLLKKYFSNYNSLTITGLAFFCVGIPATIYLFSTNFFQILSTKPSALQGLAAIAILAIFGTALAVIAYNYLIKVSGVIFAASVTYLIPIVAIIWGVFDGEKLVFLHFIWILVVILGVFLSNANEIFKLKR